MPVMNIFCNVIISTGMILQILITPFNFSTEIIWSYPIYVCFPLTLPCFLVRGGFYQMLLVLLTSRLCSKVMQYFASMLFHFWVGLVPDIASTCNDYKSVLEINNQLWTSEDNIYCRACFFQHKIDQQAWINNSLVTSWKKVAKYFLLLHSGCSVSCVPVYDKQCTWMKMALQSRHALIALFLHISHCVFLLVSKHSAKTDLPSNFSGSCLPMKVFAISTETTQSQGVFPTHHSPDF